MTVLGMQQPKHQGLRSSRQYMAQSCLAERLWQAQLCWATDEQMHFLHNELLPGHDLSSWQVVVCF